MFLTHKSSVPLPIFWKFKTRFLGLTFNIFCLTDAIWQPYLPVLFYLRSIPTRLLCVQFSAYAFPPRWMPFSLGICTSPLMPPRPLLLHKRFLCQAQQPQSICFHSPHLCQPLGVAGGCQGARGVLVGAGNDCLLMWVVVTRMYSVCEKIIGLYTYDFYFFLYLLYCNKKNWLPPCKKKKKSLDSPRPWTLQFEFYGQLKFDWNCIEFIDKFGKNCQLWYYFPLYDCDIFYHLFRSEVNCLLL